MSRVRSRYGIYAMALFSLMTFAGLQGCKASDKKSTAANSAVPVEEDRLIPFKIRTLGGKDFSLDGLKGRPIVINFWASWCGPCRLEASSIEKNYLAFRDKGVEFIGVAVQDSPSDARAFVKEFKWTFSVGLDESGDIADEYKIYGVPKTLVAGKDGKLIFTHTGAVSSEELAGAIQKAL
jgi:cytochrome c biogenesis protein CcmG, thiol:disulfide interchange protein DsbE